MNLIFFSFLSQRKLRPPVKIFYIYIYIYRKRNINFPTQSHNMTLKCFFGEQNIKVFVIVGFPHAIGYPFFSYLGIEKIIT